jgi:hypothetical protein
LISRSASPSKQWWASGSTRSSPSVANDKSAPGYRTWSRVEPWPDSDSPSRAAAQTPARQRPERTWSTGSGSSTDPSSVGMPSEPFDRAFAAIARGRVGTTNRSMWIAG